MDIIKKMNAPTVSVICTSYNSERHIGYALNSLTKQVFKDFEVIVINDGSTDNTLKIINDYALADSRIRVVNSSRIGRGRALNLGLSKSSGEFVAILDADDMSHPDRLFRQVKAMRDDSGIQFLATGLAYVDDLVDTVPLCEQHASALGLIAIQAKSLIMGNPFCHSSVMMRSEFLKNIGGYNELRSSKYDYDLYLRIGRSGESFYKDSATLTYKRKHGAQYFECGMSLSQRFASVKLQLNAISSFGGNRQAYLSVSRKSIKLIYDHWRRKKLFS